MFDLLRGVRIIDLTTIVLGPYATQILADLGAEVIKVEPPDGDLFRAAAPGHSDTMGAAFLNCNRNKHSIAIDLRKPQGVATLHRLIPSADMLVHNMRRRSSQKLGVDYETVRKLNDNIVYCYACGFGQGGKLSEEAAYDDTLQAVSGLAHLNSTADGEPRYLRTVVCDKVAGLHLAIAALAGLAARERKGRGTCIEVPMFESMVSFLLVELLSGETFNPALGTTGYGRLESPFRKPFRTSDGYISVLPYNSGHWRRFLTLAGRLDLVEDERVTDPALRSRNIDMLYRVVAEVAPTRSTAEWLRLLKEQDIPCAAVNRVQDLLADPHLADVRLFERVDHPTEGTLRSVRSPFNVPGAARAPDRPAPGLGQDGRRILRDAGFTDAEIDDVLASGALRLPG